MHNFTRNSQAIFFKIKFPSITKKNVSTCRKGCPMERYEVWGTSPLLVYLDPWWGSSKSLLFIIIIFFF